MPSDRHGALRFFFPARHNFSSVEPGVCTYKQCAGFAEDGSFAKHLRGFATSAYCAGAVTFVAPASEGGAFRSSFNSVFKRSQSLWLFLVTIGAVGS